MLQLRIVVHATVMHKTHWISVVALSPELLWGGKPFGLTLSEEETHQLIPARRSQQSNHVLQKSSKAL